MNKNLNDEQQQVQKLMLNGLDTSKDASADSTVDTSETVKSDSKDKENEVQGSVSDSYKIEQEEMEGLTKDAIGIFSPIRQNRIIDILKRFGRKAIPYIRRIGNATRFPMVKRHALDAIEDLLKQP